MPIMEPELKPQEEEPSSAIPGSFLPNSEYFIEILGAQRSGESCLPCELGMSSNEFQAMLDRHLPGIKNIFMQSELAAERGELRQQLLDMRRDEWQELYELLLKHRAHADYSEHWLAAMVAAACLGNHHLWRDLGLASRDMLKRLLQDNFPTLAEKNTGDMRWKKFLYKQLCEQQGHYLCRSPSCETCPTYAECFGDES